MFERGMISESREYFELAQKVCLAMPMPQSTRVQNLLRDTYNCLGTAYAELNDPGNSLTNQKAWLDMMLVRRDSGGNMIVDYELAQTYNELGVAYACNRRWKEATECFMQSMDIVTKQPNFEEFHLGWSAPNLGFMYWVLGKLEAAENIFNKILGIYEAKFGKDDTQSFKYVKPFRKKDLILIYHHRTGKMLHGMGNVQWSKGNRELSYDYHCRALKQYCATVGEKHHRTVAVQIRLAEHHMFRKDYGAAL